MQIKQNLCLLQDLWSYISIYPDKRVKHYPQISLSQLQTSDIIQSHNPYNIDASFYLVIAESSSVSIFSKQRPQKDFLHLSQNLHDSPNYSINSQKHILHLH